MNREQFERGKHLLRTIEELSRFKEKVKEIIPDMKLGDSKYIHVSIDSDNKYVSLGSDQDSHVRELVVEFLAKLQVVCEQAIATREAELTAL